MVGRSEKYELDLIRDEKTGRPWGRVYAYLEGPFDGIWVPPSVTIEELGEGEEALHFLDDETVLAYASHSHPWDDWHRRSNSATLWHEFVRISNASDKRVLAFAAKWGPMYLHDEGLTHGFLTHAFSHHWGQSLLDWPGFERVSDWREQAQRADAIARGASLLQHGDQVPRELWYAMVGDRRRLTPPEGRALLRRLDDVASQFAESQTDELATMLLDWRYEFSRPPSFGMGGLFQTGITTGFGFLPVVWLSLWTLAGLRHGLAICDGCKHPYSAERKPRVDTDNYCADCQDARVSNRNSARRKSQDRMRLGTQEQLPGD